MTVALSVGTEGGKVDKPKSIWKSKKPRWLRQANSTKRISQVSYYSSYASLPMDKEVVYIPGNITIIMLTNQSDEWLFSTKKVFWDNKNHHKLCTTNFLNQSSRSSAQTACRNLIDPTIVRIQLRVSQANLPHGIVPWSNLPHGIVRCSHRKIFKVRLANFQHYGIQG